MTAYAHEGVCDDDAPEQPVLRRQRVDARPASEGRLRLAPLPSGLILRLTQPAAARLPIVLAAPLLSNEGVVARRVGAQWTLYGTTSASASPSARWVGSGTSSARSRSSAAVRVRRAHLNRAIRVVPAPAGLIQPLVRLAKGCIGVAHRRLGQIELTGQRRQQRLLIGEAPGGVRPPERVGVLPHVLQSVGRSVEPILLHPQRLRPGLEIGESRVRHASTAVTVGHYLDGGTLTSSAAH